MKVVITGVGAMSSIGNDGNEIFENLSENRSNVQFYPAWTDANGLKSHLGAPVKDYDNKVIPRNVRRSMSRMSEMAFLATVDALKMANIEIEKDHSYDRTLICMGSTTGSPETLMKYYRKYIENNGPQGQLSTSFFKVMNHSVPANVALGLGFSGPMISPSSACSTSSQTIALAYELIRAGVYDVAITGGADELDVTSAAIFDVALAASTSFNNSPEKAPRPFDKDRDGLVVSEGAGIVVLESEEHAKKRGVGILGEICGAAYHCDGTHMSQPKVSSMAHTMKRALFIGDVSPEEINYVNAHATATTFGDIEESLAIESVFGSKTPTSSLKGHFGHSLAACGALEIISGLEMMSHETLIPTRNLDQPDPKCGSTNLIQKPIGSPLNFMISNNFAFGGMNTSIVLGKYK